VILRPALLALLVVHLSAGDGPDTGPAIERGLAALARLQQPDGHIGGEGAGITALAGMAFLAGGHTPTRGAFREVQAKALAAVLAAQDGATGYLGATYGNMYAHGFATLYLAECYGMAPQQPVRKALEAAVDLIWRAQNSQGGWRYAPAPVDADTSVTICQIMALRAAYNVGIGGGRTQETIQRALGFVRAMHQGNGTFAYVPGMGTSDGTDEVPRCAAGAMSLIGSGIHDPADATLGPALAFLRRHMEAYAKERDYHWWYGQYYASQAMFHSPDPQDWDRYWAVTAPAIIRRQGGNGLWSGEGGSVAYSSSMALVILQIPNHYLPIFQR
jgi:hypothetical protein